MWVTWCGHHLGFDRKHILGQFFHKNSPFQRMLEWNRRPSKYVVFLPLGCFNQTTLSCEQHLVFFWSRKKTENQEIANHLHLVAQEFCIWLLGKLVWIFF